MRSAACAHGSRGRTVPVRAGEDSFRSSHVRKRLTAAGLRTSAIEHLGARRELRDGGEGAVARACGPQWRWASGCRPAVLGRFPSCTAFAPRTARPAGADAHIAADGGTLRAAAIVLLPVAGLPPLGQSTGRSVTTGHACSWEEPHVPSLRVVTGLRAKRTRGGWNSALHGG
jgi:hypothetical protein